MGQLDPHQKEPGGAEDVLTPVGMEKWGCREQGARARTQPSISVTHCTSLACWTLAKSFQV